MREILFRGKRIDKCGWAYGGYYIVPDGEGGAIHRIAESDCEKYEYNDIMVDPSTVGQDTGLTDKNGKKIFEGDIVEYKGRILQVEYSEKYASFFFHNNGSVTGECISTNTKEYAEVIGNIIDSPQFLENDE